MLEIIGFKQYQDYSSIRNNSDRNHIFIKDGFKYTYLYAKYLYNIYTISVRIINNPEFEYEHNFDTIEDVKHYLYKRFPKELRSLKIKNLLILPL